MRIFIVADRRFHGDGLGNLQHLYEFYLRHQHPFSQLFPALARGPSLAASGEKYGELVDGLKSYAPEYTDGARLIRR